MTKTKTRTTFLDDAKAADKADAVSQDVRVALKAIWEQAREATDGMRLACRSGAPHVWRQQLERCCEIAEQLHADCVAALKRGKPVLS